MRRKINLEFIELLNIIDKQGSYASAAETLSKAPSAITYAIQKLESDLDIQLFQKKGSKVEMTPAAHVLLEEGRDILESTDILQQQVIETKSGWESEISIAVHTMLGIKYCLPVVKQLYELQPNINVTLREEALEGLWDNTINGKSDLTIGAEATPGYAIKGFDIIQLGHVHIHLVAATSHPLAQIDRTLTTDDIKPYRFVTTSNTGIRSRPDLTLSKRPPLQVPTMKDKLHAIVSGLGIGYLSDIAIDPYISTGDIVILPYAKDSSPFCSMLYLISKSSNQGKAKNWLLEKFRQKWGSVATIK
ncbi:LysR substrate-binding domain-containing protein [Thiotrichales bacterium 19S3-7]|nr:LysR substrate-binding domain-containing protein [Thiotrichales bacterium 19S3-7]MCF6800549.1 LysR substrate-binding domain-containing protein [Thiotrichales bacterium 19S3-11]